MHNSISIKAQTNFQFLLGRSITISHCIKNVIKKRKRCLYMQDLDLVDHLVMTLLLNASHPSMAERLVRDLGLGQRAEDRRLPDRTGVRLGGAFTALLSALEPSKKNIRFVNEDFISIFC
jgi:hypothetical protein